MAGRLVNIALVGLLAGCVNFAITRDTDVGLSCEQIEEVMVWAGLGGAVTIAENPFNLVFNSSNIREAVEERRAHLWKIAQEKESLCLCRQSAAS